MELPWLQTYGVATAWVHGVTMAMEVLWTFHGFGAWDWHGCGDACGFDTALVHEVAMALEMHLDLTQLRCMGSPWLYRCVWICHDFSAWDRHGFAAWFLMDSYALGVSGDTMDLVPLTIEFVDEDVVPLNVEANVLECGTTWEE